MTLHTTDSCSMGVKRKETGTVTSKNCYNGTNSNEGCGVSSTAASYGPEFNSNGGGVSVLSRFGRFHANALSRYMLLNFAMLEFASGGGLALRFRPTSLTAAPTHPPGVRLQPTSHLQTVAFHRISETKVLLPTLICADHWLLPISTILKRRTVRVIAPRTWLRIPARSQRRTGNSRVSRSINLLDSDVSVLLSTFLSSTRKSWK